MLLVCRIWLCLFHAVRKNELLNGFTRDAKDSVTALLLSLFAPDVDRTFLAPAEVADILKVSVMTVTRRFEDFPGPEKSPVFDFCSPTLLYPAMLSATP